MLLHRRRLYILPTRLGWTYGAMLLALLLGSVNYETSLGFGATFLLAGLGLAVMIRSYRNLYRLELRFGPAPAVFVGETVRFPVVLEGGRLTRWAVRLADAMVPCLAEAEQHHCCVTLTARRRGRMPLPRSVVDTIWPLGLFRVWSWVHPRVHGIVYPRPVDHGQRPPEQRTGGTGSARSRAGNDDFAGLREYHPGDSPRRIAWKSYARTDELHTKTFEAEAAGDRVLDWFDLPALGTEARLEQLACWILDADACGARYALRLPRQTLDSGSGSGHRHRCLEALALHGEISP